MIVFAVIVIVLGLCVWGFFYWLEHGGEESYEKGKTVEITNEAKIRKDFENQNFTPTKRHTYENVTLSFDKNSNKICILKKFGSMYEEGFNFSTKYFSHTDLLESKIIEDGVSVTQTSRSSQIGGALVGGIIAGGVGAIIGGLSGKTTTSQTVKSLKLQIVVNDTTKATQEMIFILDNKGVSKDSEYYKGVISNINEWHNIISVLINKADKEENGQLKNEPFLNNTSNINTSEEIRKLYDLFKEGILTQEEFELQKKKLIG
ncbi:SHOCT domain-containing protein [Peribacillus butanolivorans]|uniref:SHOCT domain-containing protein n=1 Tax=Peribacillus butanolivorans TaxID=421767 RepID=UPI0039FC4E66